MKIGLYGVHHFLTRQILLELEADFILLDDREQDFLIQGKRERVFSLETFPLEELEGIICLKETKISGSIPSYFYQPGKCLMVEVQEILQSFLPYQDARVHVYPSMAHYGLDGFREYQKELSSIGQQEEESSFQYPVLNNLSFSPIGTISYQQLLNSILPAVQVTEIQTPILRVDTLEIELSSQQEYSWDSKDMVNLARSNAQIVANQELRFIGILPTPEEHQKHFFIQMDSVYLEIRYLRKWLQGVNSK